MAATNPLNTTPPTDTIMPVTPPGGNQPPLADGTTGGTTTPSTSSINPLPATVAKTDVTNAGLTAAVQPQTGLVSNNVTSLIDQNSPLMQRAAAKAAEQSNARGMLNSSMAVGDAQNAVIANATPIAQSDAASTNQFALTNAQAANQNAQFNAGAANTVGTANTNAANTAALQTQQIGATAAQNTQSQQSQAVLQVNQTLQQAATTHDQQVTAIMSDPNMSTDAKNAALATLNSNYLSFQQSYKALAGMPGVTQLLNFGAAATPVTSASTPGSNAGYIASNDPGQIAAAAAKKAEFDASPQSATSPTSTYYPKLGYVWSGNSWMAPVSQNASYSGVNS